MFRTFYNWNLNYGEYVYILLESSFKSNKKLILIRFFNSSWPVNVYIRYVYAFIVTHTSGVAGKFQTVRFKRNLTMQSLLKYDPSSGGGYARR